MLVRLASTDLPVDGGVHLQDETPPHRQHIVTAPLRGERLRVGELRSGMGLGDVLMFQKCQNLSQKICFTAAKHSGVKNGHFGPFPNPRPMKNWGSEGENLHIRPASVQVFRSNFAASCVFVSTPNFQKSTPNFQKSLTFFSQRTLFFGKISLSR